MIARSRTVGRRAFLGAIGGAALLLAACAGPAKQGHGATPARSSLAPYTGSAAGSSVSYPTYVTPALEDAYRFALERPDVLRALPCYCGCGLTSGHRSNLDCFVAGAGSDGAVLFDEHASYCQTCLDIARDARDMLAQGRSLKEIREAVDARHGAKGPATDTPKPA